MNPPPVYAPEVVAEAILHCAENPERDVIVGGGGKALTAMSYYAPRVTDKVMEATMFDLQKSDEPRPPRKEDSLHTPMQDGAERGGYPGHVAESSIYTKASLRPWLMGAVLAGAGLVFAATRKSARVGDGHSDNGTDSR